MSFAGQELSWRQFLSRQCPFSRRADSRRRPSTRRLSVDEAVRLALEQNLGIRIERLNPEIQDLADRADARRLGAVAVDQPQPDVDRVGADEPVRRRAEPRSPTRGSRRQLGVTQVLPTGGDYTRELEQLAALVDQLLPHLRSAAALEPVGRLSRSRCSATSRSTTSGSSSRSTARSARTATRRCSRRSRRPCAT